MKRRVFAICLVLVIIFNLAACNKSRELTRYSATFLSLFDTVTTIIGYAESEENFNEFAQLIHNELNIYHELYDIYNDYEGINNIKTINDNAGIAPVKVDQKIIDLLLFSKDAYELSDGKINVAFGSVLSVWHDYREHGTDYPEEAKLPPMELLTEMNKHTDVNKVIINEAETTVYIEDPMMRLDVGAIAKGYATEMIVQKLISEGYTNGLLSVGGNVRAIGYRAEEEKEWVVGIQNPEKESEEPYLKILSMTDLSLVSSGDYERYYTVDGVEYHHIIDPITLMPAQYFTAVSIVTEHSGLADALSTTLYNMSYEEGYQLIEGMTGSEAMWVMKDGELKYSTGFEKYIKK